MLDALKKDYPAVTDDVQKTLAIGEIQKILQGLLRERISIRNLVRILETAADYGEVSKKADFLIEKCRQALNLQISQQYADSSQSIRVITIESSLERQIIDSGSESIEGNIVALPPEVYQQFIATLRDTVLQVQESGHTPIMLTSEAARPLVKQLTLRTLPQLIVLSVLEIAHNTTVHAIATVRIASSVEAV